MTDIESKIVFITIQILIKKNLDYISQYSNYFRVFRNKQKAATYRTSSVWSGLWLPFFGK